MKDAVVQAGGYLERVECRVHLVVIPSKLYKYRSISPPGTDPARDFTRQMVVDRLIYFSSVSEFNDPFEFRFRVKALSGTKRSDWLRISQGLSEMDEAQRFWAVVERRPIDLERAAANTPVTYRTFLNENSGVFCLSQERDELLLWAHYAGSHRGICLEFSTAYEPFTDDLYGVQYQDDVPMIDLVNVDWVAFSNAVLLGKSPHWKYEKEWRLIRMGIKARACRYPPEALTGVITGCQFDESRLDELKSWIDLSGASPKLYRAVIDTERYAIQVEGR